MADSLLTGLSRRERQIMDFLFQSGRATAADVQASLPEPPSYSAVRAMLRVLEEKGHVRHEQDGPRYVYVPKVARDKAKRSALRHVLRTFFDGSTEQVVAALLDTRVGEASEQELDRMAQLIDKARKQGAQP
jgi:BlaI family transcriptional regulator, penicillinase repressor